MTAFVSLETGGTDNLLLETADNLLLEIDYVDMAAALAGTGSLTAADHFVPITNTRIVKDRRPTAIAADRRAALGLSLRQRHICLDLEREILYGRQERIARPISRRETIAWALQNRRLCKEITAGPSGGASLTGLGSLSATLGTCMTDVLYQDLFERGASNDIGSPWIEVEEAAHALGLYGDGTLVSWNANMGHAYFGDAADLGNQFCEMEYSGSNVSTGPATDIAAGAGPMVMWTGGTFGAPTAYLATYFELKNATPQPNTLHYELRLRKGSSELAFVDLGSANPFAAGTILRIEARNLGSETEVKVFRDGVLKISYTDAAGDRQTHGRVGVGTQGPKYGLEDGLQRWRAWYGGGCPI